LNVWQSEKIFQQNEVKENFTEIENAGKNSQRFIDIAINIHGIGMSAPDFINVDAAVSFGDQFGGRKAAQAVRQNC